MERRCFVLGCWLALSALAFGAEPPRVLLQGQPVADEGAASGARTSFAIMRMPDGSFAFYDQHRPQSGPLTLPDRDGNPHQLLPGLPRDVAESRAIVDSGVLANTQVILTPEREAISVFVKGEEIDRETAARVGLPRFLNVWVRRAGLLRADEPQMVWRGYNGSQMEYEQLPSGRIIVPYGSFQPHAKAEPPIGRHKTIIQYSDDGGRTWNESESKLVSPCYPGFNGSNEGACEPAIERLEDGRIWMLMRTSAGFLYESFSHDDGTTWEPARASRFNTSTGPPNIMRHKNGWLVVTWNNCEMPPRADGAGVYGGRDALHIAVSDDDGSTWRGFREIYLDHRRHDNPAETGDRGTAYPLGAYDAEGRIVMLAGQGRGGRNPILIDPEWIIETTASTDFSEGLEGWSVYKHHGPAKGWWRARAVGCELIANPTDSTSRCLHVRRPDELPADGATWNFPNGWKGSLTARVMIREGSKGGIISLNDRMFDPTNDAGEEFAVFRTQFREDEQIGGVTMDAEKWYDITLAWDLDKETCKIDIDGQSAGEIPLRHPTLNGISYVRFRSVATEIDTAGFLVDRVSVTIDDACAPLCTPQDQAAQERRYVRTIVPRWKEELTQSPN